MEDKRFEVLAPAQVAEAIRSWNEDDLRYLNRLIVDRLKLIHQARSTVMLAHFNVGDRVRFTVSDGSERAGVIIRLNKKTASLVTDEGQRWNVHPVYLRAETPPPASSQLDAGAWRAGDRG